MMIAGFIRFSLLSLLVMAPADVSAYARLCGTVTLPAGETFASGDIKVRLNFLGIGSPVNPETNVDPATRAYCVSGSHVNNHGVSATVTLRNPAGATKTFSTHGIRWINEGATKSEQIPTYANDMVMDFSAHINADINQSTLVFHGLNEESGLAATDFHFIPNSAYFNKVISSSFGNGNQISNGSFEMDNDIGHPVDWELIKGSGWGAPSSSGAVKFQNISASTRTGTQLVGVGFSKMLSTPRLVTSSVFRLEPSTDYILSFYYRALSVSGTFKPALEVWRNSDFIPSYSGTWSATPNYTPAGEWTLYSFAFNSGEGASIGQLSLLETSGGTSGVFFFDDVLLEKSDGAVSPAGSQATTERSVSFFNGSNLLEQSLRHDGNRDIVTGNVYDDMGRVTRASLPVGYDYLKLTGRHWLYPRLFGTSEPGNLEWTYTNASSGAPLSGGWAYSETIYENSPLNRARRVLNPGSAWRARPLITDYWSTDGLNPTGPDATPGPRTNPKYFYTLSTDEDGSVSRAFTDKFGRKVKSGQKIGGRWLDVNYKFDGLGNPIEVTPPPGHSGSVKTFKTFNSLGQMTYEDSEDFGDRKILYDPMGRVRFTQTENQRAFGKFNYRKYDSHGRMIEMGEYRSAASFTQALADNPAFPAQGNNRVAKIFNFYDSKPVIRALCNDPTGDLDIFARSDYSLERPHEYSDLNAAYDVARQEIGYKTSYSGQVTLYQIIDSPSQPVDIVEGTVFNPLALANGGKVSFQIRGILRGSPEFNNLGNPFPHAVEWGPLEGRLTQTVVCNTDLEGTHLGVKPLRKVFNYDKFGNVTQVFEFNGYVEDGPKRWQKTEQKFDPQNRVRERKVMPDASSPTAEVSYGYKYDHLGRLSEVIEQPGTVVVARHYYDNLGRLSAVELGRGSSPLRVDYKYHFRGWLKEIKATALTRGEVFSQQLRYEDALAGETAQFDGNIAAFNYRLMGMAQELYNFQYDAGNRLTNASTTKGTDLKAGSARNFIYAYHDNGTFNSITRDGQAFNYRYYGATNQLERVEFSGSHPRQTNAPETFKFDGDGRLYEDLSRDYVISYDDGFDRPFLFSKLTPNGMDRIYMVYDEAGNRKSKFMFVNDVFAEAKHYFSNKEIREYPGTLKEVYDFDQFGRTTKNAMGAKQFEIYLKNHLGSTMEVFNTTSDILAYKADYEPFGRLRSEVQQGDEVTAKFTGKENDEELGLDYFGARFFDPELGMWISPDVARQHFSPYNYSDGNPINKIDPDGNFDVFIEHKRYYGATAKSEEWSWNVGSWMRSKNTDGWNAAADVVDGVEHLLFGADRRNSLSNKAGWQRSTADSDILGYMVGEGMSIGIRFGSAGKNSYGLVGKLAEKMGLFGNVSFNTWSDESKSGFELSIGGVANPQQYEVPLQGGVEKEIGN